jgi:hypothetical protein
MRRLLAIAAVILMGCGAGHAQTSMSTPAMGATSPLGTLGPSGSSATGIPLGATEIDPGGVSPTVIVNCNSGLSGMNASGTGMTVGATSTFDGGGLTAVPSTTSTSSCAPSQTLSLGGTASPLSNPGRSSSSMLNGGIIPLGATEMDSGGVSPIITVPVPSGATPCTGSITMAGSSSSTGPTSNGVGALQPSSGC